MNIPALSTTLSTLELSGELGIAIMSKALDTAEVTGDAIAQMMEAAVTGLGQNLDIRVQKTAAAFLLTVPTAGCFRETLHQRCEQTQPGPGQLL